LTNAEVISWAFLNGKPKASAITGNTVAFRASHQTTLVAASCLADYSSSWEDLPLEKVVSKLTEAPVARGHKVALFAATGSRTSAELVKPVSCRPVRAKRDKQSLTHHELQPT
jgi:hypothetical protein